MNALQDIVAVILALAACAYVGRFVWRTMAGKQACGCGQGKPCHRAVGQTERNDRDIVVRPLISADQIGLPQGDGTGTGASKDHSPKV